MEKSAAMTETTMTRLPAWAATNCLKERTSAGRALAAGCSSAECPPIGAMYYSVFSQILHIDVQQSAI